MLNKRDFAEIKVGEKVCFSKTISEADIVLFAGVCGDFNPIHVDKEFAKDSFFKERVAHGMLYRKPHIHNSCGDLGVWRDLLVPDIEIYRASEDG